MKAIMINLSHTDLEQVRQITQMEKKLSEAIDLIKEALGCDGGHHKQWYLIEIGKLLGIDEELLEALDGGEAIAP